MFIHIQGCGVEIDAIISGLLAGSAIVGCIYRYEAVKANLDWFLFLGNDAPTDEGSCKNKVKILHVSLFDSACFLGKCKRINYLPIIQIHRYEWGITNKSI